MPDPPAQEFLEHEFFDLDPYDYWMSTEYDEDPYYDASTGTAKERSDPKVGGKRKRAASLDGKSPVKRRKGTSAVQKLANTEADQEVHLPGISWQPMAETHSIRNEHEAVYEGPIESFALLPDWRERLKDARGFDISAPRETTVDMEDVEGATMTAVDEEEDWSDEDEDGGDIDPEMLKAALAAKLGTGIDQEAFMRSIMQMMSGGGEANMDDIVGELATDLLNQASEGGAGSEVTQWLTEQGVSIPEEDDDGQSVNDEKYVTSGTGPKELGLSPGDSAVSMTSAKSGQMDSAGLRKSLGTPSQTKTEDSTTQGLSQASEAPLVTPRRLSHVLIQNGSASPTKKSPQKSLASAKEKKKKVSFAIPEELDPDDAVLNAEPVINGVSQAQQPEHPTAENANKLPARQTSKRKAPADGADAAISKPKRQLRSFAAPTASSKGKAVEPAKRVTRSVKQKK